MKEEAIVHIIRKKTLIIITREKVATRKVIVVIIFVIHHILNIKLKKEQITLLWVMGLEPIKLLSPSGLRAGCISI